MFCDVLLFSVCHLLHIAIKFIDSSVNIYLIYHQSSECKTVLVPYSVIAVICM